MFSFRFGLLVTLMGCRGAIPYVEDTAVYPEPELSSCGEAASYYMCHWQNVDGANCTPEDYWEGFELYYNQCNDLNQDNQACWECMLDYNHWTECPPSGVCSTCEANALEIHDNIKLNIQNWYCEE